MEGSFKLPKLIVKQKRDLDIPKFEWARVIKEKKLGSGTFGSVYLAKYGSTSTSPSVVVKKLKSVSIDSQTRFLKEAKILNSVKGHRNVIEFLGFCDQPHSIMMNYSSFDFGLFGVEKNVSSLADFLQFVDAELDFSQPSLFNLLPVCVKDILTGLDYLHQRKIAHRDLKPANILVCNQHLKDVDPDHLNEAFQQCPIICRLTDFGLSRSVEIQTKTLLMSKTKSVGCGTPAYMAPEMFLNELASATHEDLKRADMWSLGLVVHTMMNPESGSPYRAEMEESGVANPEVVLKDLLAKRQLPKHGPKYEKLRVTSWWQLEDVFKLCAKFNPEDRFSSAQMLCFHQNSLNNCFRFFPMSISQSSALDQHDDRVAAELQEATGTTAGQLGEQPVPLPANDATNCCAFLCLSVCDRLLHDGEFIKEPEWKHVRDIIEDIIVRLPLTVNEYRDVDRFYDVTEAYTILSSNQLLLEKYNISEECVTGNTIFSAEGRQEILCILQSKISSGETAMGIYTCSPYIFTVGICNNSLFLVDTHSVNEDLGGNGNALLMVTPDTSYQSCKLVVQWLLRRLALAGVEENSSQSMSWLTFQDHIDSPCHGENDQQDTYRNSNQKSVEIQLQVFPVIDGNENETDMCMEVTTTQAETKCNLSREHERVEIADQSENTQNGITTITPSIEENSNNTQDPGDKTTDDGSSSDDDVDVRGETFQPFGEPYKGDTLTPVFAWNKIAYTGEQLVCLLLGTYEPELTCISQPINVSHNVSFLVDANSLQHQDDLKCDDMGAWKHNGSPRSFFHVEKDHRGIRIYPVDKKDARATQSRDDVYELKRTYYKNSSDQDVRKIVSKLYDNSAKLLPLVLVQYLFKGPEHEIKSVMPHGNAKSKSGYRRLLPSMREKMKKSILDKDKTAHEVLDEVYVSSGDVIKARSLGELPRGPSDMYNARRSAKKTTDIQSNDQSKTGDGCKHVNLDTVWTLLERAKREEDESKDSVFIRECSIHPDLFIVLANNQQLSELVQFCTNPRGFSVFGIDPTFNIFDRNISLTVTTYRNLKLEKSNTGKPPVFIGPLLMHQRKDWKTFSKFANSLTTAKPDLEGILACGTDGEKALVDGFKRNMRYAIFLRCFLHFKDNVKRELTARGIATEAKNQYLTEIFGKQEGSTKYTGLVDSESADVFDSRLEGLRPEWEEREAMHGNKEKKQSFFEWFRCEKATDMKDSMLKSVRTDAGLGDPPSEYTNNDPEAANFMIKHGLHFDAQKPHEFINKIKNIIETQQRNEERAVFGKGPYRVRQEFAFLTVNDIERSRLNHAQLTKKLLDFKKAGMNDMKDVTSSIPPDDLGKETAASRIGITAGESGITSIPAPILESIFEKASNLLEVPGNVIPKPGANDGSFLVAGTSNKVHSVVPGKGGSLSCDRSCVNFSTKICEHVLAVAQVRGMLDEFIAWFKRKRKRTMMGMVEQGGPKSAGKKPSTRKRTNAKQPPIEKYVDLLANDINHSRPVVMEQPSADAETTHQQHPPFLPPMSTFPYPSYASQPSVSPSMLSPDARYDMPQWPTSSCPYPTMANRFSSFAQTNFNSCNVSQMSATTNHPSPFPSSHVRTPACTNPNMSTACLPTSCFQLKWVHGTKVSKCYGCGRDIINPPQQRPDDLVVVCRDVREFRGKLTGQLQRSSTPQNVHFHLQRECILMRYPAFHVGFLVVSDEFRKNLHHEHIARLTGNFGWSNNL